MQRFCVLPTRGNPSPCRPKNIRLPGQGKFHAIPGVALSISSGRRRDFLDVHYTPRRYFGHEIVPRSMRDRGTVVNHSRPRPHKIETPRQASKTKPLQPPNNNYYAHCSTMRCQVIAESYRLDAAHQSACLKLSFKKWPSRTDLDSTSVQWSNSHQPGALKMSKELRRPTSAGAADRMRREAKIASQTEAAISTAYHFQ